MNKSAQVYQSVIYVSKLAEEQWAVKLQALVSLFTNLHIFI